MFILLVEDKKALSTAVCKRLSALRRPVVPAQGQIIRTSVGGAAAALCGLAGLPE